MKSSVLEGRGEGGGYTSIFCQANEGTIAVCPKNNRLILSDGFACFFLNIQIYRGTSDKKVMILNISRKETTPIGTTFSTKNSGRNFGPETTKASNVRENTNHKQLHKEETTESSCQVLITHSLIICECFKYLKSRPSLSRPWFFRKKRCLRTNGTLPPLTRNTKTRRVASGL